MHESGKYNLQVETHSLAALAALCDIAAGAGKVDGRCDSRAPYAGCCDRDSPCEESGDSSRKAEYRHRARQRPGCAANRE